MQQGQRSLHIVHTEASTGRGGQEFRILGEAAGFLQRGHQITLLTPAEGFLAQEAARRHITVLPLPIGRKNLSGLLALYRQLKNLQPRVHAIMSHSSTDTWLGAVARLMMKDAPPLLRTRHVSSPVNRSPLTHWLYCRACVHVVVTGEALRQRLHEHNGYPLAQMTSVPTGIDLNLYQRRHSAPEARQLLDIPQVFSVGIVATLRSWKGHPHLFEALASLPAQEPWQLLVVGDGPQREALQQRAALMGLQERIRFLGHREDVPLCLNAMDIFVLPSTGDEGVPQAILQAMACEVPVISTEVGAIAEAVRHEHTGLLVPPRDVAALRAAIVRLTADEALRQQLVRSAHGWVADHYSLATMLDRMENIFQRFAAPGS